MLELTLISLYKGCNVIKKFSKFLCVLGCLMSLDACSFDSYVTWQEEVKLNDGRIIIVEQKKRNQRGIAREAWLTIKLPEFSAQPIIWHENADPLVLNIDNGKLYVVASPPTQVEARHYGCTRPPFVGFVWEHGTWVRIPFDGIPKRIYATNMLIDSFPPKGTSFLSLEQKNGPQLNGEPTHHFLLQVNPNMGSGC